MTVYFARFLLYRLSSRFEQNFELQLREPLLGWLFRRILLKVMDQRPSVFLPPESVRGMTNLNRQLFEKLVKVPSLSVRTADLQTLVAGLRKYKFLLSVPNVPTVARYPETDGRFETHRLLLFNADRVGSPADRQQLSNLILNLLKSRSRGRHESETDSDGQLPLGSACFFWPSPRVVVLRYENFSRDDIFSIVLPADPHSVGNISNIASFSMIGHIIHVNLKPHLLPYKTLIAQVLLDKVPKALTVVNKPQAIDNQFRNVEVELLAGLDDYNTETTESGCNFRFDFSKVFWNPRLATEHGRVLRQVNSLDVIYDVFAGIGPFVIPAVKSNKRVFCLCNDLNPVSYQYLVDNLKRNLRVTDLTTVADRVRCFNLDGRQFVRTAVRDDLLNRQFVPGEGVPVPMGGRKIRILMNLPALAVEFLDSFVGLLPADWNGLADLPPIHVYCYCFDVKDLAEARRNTFERIKQHLGVELGAGELVEFRVVRDVSPNKLMYCVEFLMPVVVLTGSIDCAGAKRTSSDLIDCCDGVSQRKISVIEEKKL